MTTIELPTGLITALREANHIAALTGAGVSAESGVPTFREAQTGLWAQYDPQQLATPQAFRRQPKLVWEWYTWRRQLVAQAGPNPGHYALVTMEQHAPRFTLITQNVDGLHAIAGSENVVYLHGDITRTKCADCGRFASTWDETEQAPPRCTHCNGRLRPDVVWFGENLPHDALETAVAAATQCDLFFSIGTSALVQPAASLPIAAHQYGVTTVEINPQPTPVSDLMTYVLRGAAGEVLPALVAAAWP